MAIISMGHFTAVGMRAKIEAEDALTVFSLPRGST